MNDPMSSDEDDASSFEDDRELLFEDKNCLQYASKEDGFSYQVKLPIHLVSFQDSRLPSERKANLSVASLVCNPEDWLRYGEVTDHIFIGQRVYVLRYFKRILERRARMISLHFRDRTRDRDL